MRNAPLIISPHLDDAILSCGQYMADRLGTTVVTVFSGMPNDRKQLTSYDKTCGFDDAAHAIQTRRDEDKNACSALMAEPIHLDFIDEQYGQENDIDEISKRLNSIIKEQVPEYVLFPLGLTHPDHLRVSSIVTHLDHKRPMYAYEELPARILFPETIEQRLKHIGAKELKRIGEGDLSKKMDAVWCYRSQLGVLDRRCLFVPERFWSV